MDILCLQKTPTQLTSVKQIYQWLHFLLLLNMQNYKHMLIIFETTWNSSVIDELDSRWQKKNRLVWKSNTKNVGLVPFTKPMTWNSFDLQLTVHESLLALIKANFNP